MPLDSVARDDGGGDDDDDDINLYFESIRINST